MLPDRTIPGSLADLLAVFRSCFTTPIFRTFTVCRSKIRFGPVSCGDAVRSGSVVVVLVDQAVDDVGALDPGGHIDRLGGLVQRRSLFPRLVWPMTVVMP